MILDGKVVLHQDEIDKLIESSKDHDVGIDKDLTETRDEDLDQSLP